jgi:hypothetical protein
MKKNRQNQAGTSERATGDTGTARDREMGRGGEPLGDRGRGNETWTPPPGEQGISNRPDDEGIDTTSAQGLAEDDDAEFEETDDEFEEEGDGFEDDDEGSGRPA